MMFSKFKYRVDEETNIRDLSGKIMLDLRKRLDTGPQDLNWREFAARLSKRYVLKQREIETMGMKIYCEGGSPSDQLFLELGGRGFTVVDLADILHQMRLGEVLYKLVHDIPIMITRQPKAYLEVFEGSPFTLSLEAYGLPYPRYTWFKHDFEIPGASSAVLKVDYANLDDSTIFICRIHNPQNLKEVIFSTESEVKVISRPYKEDRNEGDRLHFPVITQHPYSQTVYLRSILTLECHATGSSPLIYKWYKENNLFTEMSVPYLKVDVTESSGGWYKCVVMNSFSQAISEPAIIVVERPKYSSPIPKYPQEARSPEIINHPKCCTIEVGGVAVFSCESRGLQPLSYKWYKNGEPIPDSNRSELKLRDIFYTDKGFYQCLVKSPVIDKEKLSQGAVLEVTSCTPELTAYTATDKVALLIGNYEYRCEDILRAPKPDIQILSAIFSSLGFKVVSLLNLTLIEMKNAVEKFCELLGSGVYGVFYFCGHGFEEKKEIYLVPQDAPTGYLTNHCLRSDYVLSRMQRKQPQISCLILDVCRTPNKMMSADGSKQEDLEAIPTNNTIFLYATSEGNQAYESKTHGLLVKYLQKHLQRDLSIEEIIARVREEFGNASLPEDKIQNPQIKSNLSQPRRSFKDKIEYRGHTEAFNQRQLIWEQCLVKPRSMEIKALPEDLGIVLVLDFQADFANVLTIFVTVKDSGTTKGCIAWIGRHPNTISTLKDTPIEVTESSKNYRKTKNALQDIQKLKGSLQVSIYIANVENQEMISDETILELGFPLVSPLMLWKESPLGFTYVREATEQDDNMH